MVEHSAGILLYRFREGKLEVLLVHPGGPFWARRDDGAWSIPKGKIEENEKPFDAAIRELKEETGFEIGGVEKEFIYLKDLRQPSGKIISIWAFEKDVDETKSKSNTFTLEWPKNSGNMREYPEADRVDWFGIEQAKIKILKGQKGFLDRLMSVLKYFSDEKEGDCKRAQKTLF